jgi:mRNA interferase RelE/StbE
MRYEIRYSEHIDLKRFKRLPTKDKKRIKQAIEKKLAVDPFTFGKSLRKSLYGCRSLRVGDYRIIYRIQGNIVDILAFGHRSWIYTEAEKIL